MDSDDTSAPPDQPSDSARPPAFSLTRTRFERLEARVAELERLVQALLEKEALNHADCSGQQTDVDRGSLRGRK
jgi:hypothetical protein